MAFAENMRIKGYTLVREPRSVSCPPYSSMDRFRGWKQMPPEAMWGIMRWPFHAQALNDKFSLMPWLKRWSKQPAFPVSPSSKLWNDFLRLTNATFESFTRTSCCWWMWGLFLEDASVRQPRRYMNRGKPVAFVLTVIVPDIIWIGGVKIKTSKTTKGGR